jgi:hypothetical protein
MKTKKELLRIWKDKEKNFNNLNDFEKLTSKEKLKIFDYLVEIK